MEGQGLPACVSLKDARDMNCDCGNNTCMPGYRFKKLSKIMTGQPQDTVIPIEMYLCTACGKPLQELLPIELREVKTPTIE